MGEQLKEHKHGVTVIDDGVLIHIDAYGVTYSIDEEEEIIIKNTFDDDLITR